MENRNITLSLPKDLLVKIKHIAIDRNTSVSGLLAKTLKEIAEREDGYMNAMKHHLDILENDSYKAAVGKISWKRDELHER